MRKNATLIKLKLQKLQNDLRVNIEKKIAIEQIGRGFKIRRYTMKKYFYGLSFGEKKRLIENVINPSDGGRIFVYNSDGKNFKLTFDFHFDVNKIAKLMREIDFSGKRHQNHSILNKGDWMWVPLHRGHRLGRVKRFLFLNAYPQLRHFAG